jgi:hypothetical protein
MEKVFTLKYPFEIEKDGLVKNIIELKLKRLKVKDLKNLPPDYFSSISKGVTLTQVTPLIASMNNMGEEDLDQLDMADALELLSSLENFF